MPKFSYISRNIQGQRVTAVADAESKRDLMVYLKEKGLTTIEIQELGVSAGGAAKPKEHFFARFITLRGANVGEMAIFWRQFATMIAAGLTIVDAIESISQEQDENGLKRVLDAMVVEMWEGSNFSESMRRHSRLFSPMVVSLIAAAEESGSLPAVSNHLADYLENRDRLMTKVRTAFAYPVFICVFFIGVLFFSAFWVIPHFRDVYSGFHAKLPVLTQWVFLLDMLFVRFFPIIACVVLVSGLYLAWWAGTPRGRLAIDRGSFHIPIFGKLLLRAVAARLCRSLSVLLSGGVPINRALEMAEGASGNAVVEGAIRNVREDILKGNKIAASLRKQAVFPKMMIRMVSSGEETGNLPFLLEKTAEFYEARVDAALAMIQALIEPTIIVIIGAFVLVFVLALYLPIFSLGNSMRF